MTLRLGLEMNKIIGKRGFKMFINNRLFAKLKFVYLTTLLLSISVFAQSSSYRINVGDRLNIAFWEYPEMNTVATVSRDGDIELPIVGRIRAEGQTIGELRNAIISRLAIYNKLVNQLSITVAEYGRNVVFVTGQVMTPGKYSFEEIPNLWQILLEAGGPRETATLDNVTIVRGDGKGQVISVNLAKAIQNGTLSELPEIRPGDTISVGGTLPTGEASPSPLTEKKEIFIVGAVQTPGPQRFEEGLNLMEALGRAGGPTVDANLKKTTYIVVDEGNTRVIAINLDDYLKNKVVRPVPVLRPGSTLYIPEKKPSQLLTAVLTSIITAGIATTAILVTR
jgi:protein involved in polysaccharide export with SLBB domain